MATETFTMPGIAGVWTAEPTARGNVAYQRQEYGEPITAAEKKALKVHHIQRHVRLKVANGATGERNTNMVRCASGLHTYELDEGTPAYLSEAMHHFMNHEDEPMQTNGELKQQVADLQARVAQLSRPAADAHAYAYPVTSPFPDQPVVPTTAGYHGGHGISAPIPVKSMSRPTNVNAAEEDIARKMGMSVERLSLHKHNAEATAAATQRQAAYEKQQRAAAGKNYSAADLTPTERAIAAQLGIDPAKVAASKNSQ